jgi:hypothetical protein
MVETKLSIDENEREKWYFGHMGDGVFVVTNESMLLETHISSDI